VTEKHDETCLSQSLQLSWDHTTKLMQWHIGVSRVRCEGTS
jgi:hypothetical protein